MNFYGLLRPALFALEPETAHRMAIFALKAGLFEAYARKDDPILAQRLWNLDFSNPIGLAAGFDKNAEVPDAMLGLGLGFTEIGTVTPEPQIGNPRPRLFRLVADRALINRLGFNNDGLDIAAARLAHRSKQGIVGANIGQNKDSADAIADYAVCAARLSPFADYLVVNVSSPNTPGLRALQGREPLARLLGAVKEARDRAVPKSPPPLLVKIAPDLSEEDLRDIAEVARALPVDGLIATNTTIARPSGLADVQTNETGGLSGKPLFESSTRVLASLHKLTNGALPLIGVGGVGSGQEAYTKIRAGASLIQLYTALVYEGPGLIGAIKRDLAALLRRDGFTSLQAAVGADRR